MDGDFQIIQMRYIGRYLVGLRKVTLVINRLREIQYKLLHGAIYTREHLLRFGFVEDNLCSFRKQKIETYLHLFWERVHVQRLWQNVIAKFELRELRSVDWMDIHLGLSGNSPRIKIFNTIIFAMKYWIYRCRGKSVILSLGDFKKKLLEFKGRRKEYCREGREISLTFTEVGTSEVFHEFLTLAYCSLVLIHLYFL